MSEEPGDYLPNAKCRKGMTRMREVRVVLTFILTLLLLALGIDGFWGGVSAGQVGAFISLVGAAISFLLLVFSLMEPHKD